MSGPWKTKKGWSTPLHSLHGPIYAPPPPRRVATLPIRSVRVPRRRTDSLHVVYTSTPQLLLPTPPLPAGRRSSPRGKPHSRDSLSLSRSYFDWLGCPRGVRRYAAEERFFDSLVASGFALPRSSPWHLILFPSPRTSGFPPVDNATDRPSCGQRRLCCLSLYASLPPQAGPRWSVVR